MLLGSNLICFETGSLCSGNEKGFHVDELAQKLKLPKNKIMYLSLPLFLSVSLWLLLSVSLIHDPGNFLFLISGRESIRALEDEGMIYSTIDEFHFKATSSS